MSEAYGLIFDIDGVLVDSYQAHFLSWRQMLERHDSSMTEPQFAASFGRRSVDILELVGYGEDLTAEQIGELDEEKESLYRDLVQHDFPEMPGASELIRQLDAAHFQQAVGSSGPPENVQLALERLTEGALISAQVTGADVIHGKPHPEVFLLAADRMEVPPARCAVIEDATAGIQAANAAGMVSIALLSTGHTRAEFAEADRIVEKLTDLTPAAIQEMIDATKLG